MPEIAPGPDAPIIVELAGVPSGKGRPRFARAGAFVRTYTDAKTRTYEGELRAAAADVMRGRAPIEGPIVVMMEAYLPIPASWSQKKRAQALAGALRPTSKPDVDNLAKILDAFNQVVFVDDKQIVDGRIVKAYSDRPRLVVTVGAV